MTHLQGFLNPLSQRDASEHSGPGVTFPVTTSPVKSRKCCWASNRSARGPGEFGQLAQRWARDRTLMPMMQMKNLIFFL